MLKICITGAAGMISSYLIPNLVNGSVFPDKKIILSLLDINAEFPINQMKAIIAELEDCNYKNLESVSYSTNSDEAFKNCDLIIFLGGFPRKEGMERSDLLKINGKIFSNQANSLLYVNKNCKLVVIANPCNTNAKILFTKIIKNPKLSEIIHPRNITCCSRLDHNRANSYYKKENKINENKIFIWGNHSKTLFLDSIDKNVKLTDELNKKVKERGGEIIKIKGKSSSFSAANAICDHIKDWCYGNKEIVSMGVVSEGEYGVTKDLIFSFPVKCKGNWEIEIVKDIEINEEKKDKINVSVKELEKEAKEIEGIV